MLSREIIAGPLDLDSRGAGVDGAVTPLFLLEGAGAGVPLICLSIEHPAVVIAFRCIAPDGSFTC